MFSLKYKIARINENPICYHAPIRLVRIRLVTEYFPCNRTSMNFQIHEITINVTIKFEKLKISMKLQTIKPET